MFARVTRFDIRPESLQQGHHKIEEHLIPALRMQKGYSGGLLLANREDHKMLAVTLWEDEHMRATDEAPTGLGSSMPKPSTARSETSRSTRSTAHDWIIQSRELTQHTTNDPRSGIDPHGKVHFLPCFFRDGCTDVGVAGGADTCDQHAYRNREQQCQRHLPCTRHIA
jgi:hypothetical protein